ncbi:MAG: BCD family MFS transporter [Pseudomonadota bacterium]
MADNRAPLSMAWTGMSSRFLPFADAASEDLPLGRLLRLSLFQVSAGMVLALLTGAINRVMIVELSVPAWLVALMVSLPLVFAPFRALIGHKSDTHISVLGWRRGPYIWFGSLFMFGGLAIMPWALLVLSPETDTPVWAGQAGAALAFLAVGAGLHTTQTAGLALATDIAPVEKRPRVVALLYVMLLIGMGLSAYVFGILLQDFTHEKLVKVIQGSAVAAMVFNMVALWKQEARDHSADSPSPLNTSFRHAWKGLLEDPQSKRLLLAVGLGTAAFAMQDILLEPYGAEILAMTVSQTTQLTALFAAGSILGFALAAHRLTRGANVYRLASWGILIGVAAFSAVIFADPIGSVALFRLGAGLIGVGGGLFSVCMLAAAMSLAKNGNSGIALGAWGAIQATAAGVALAAGGAIRDVIEHLAGKGMLGPALTHDAVGYSVVYHIEIFLLFTTLAAIGPLVRYAPTTIQTPSSKKAFGLAAFPG